MGSLKALAFKGILKDVTRLQTVLACGRVLSDKARESIHTTIMELRPQNHNKDGLLGPNSMIVVYVDPLGKPAILLARNLTLNPEP